MLGPVATFDTTKGKGNGLKACIREGYGFCVAKVHFYEPISCRFLTCLTSKLSMFTSNTMGYRICLELY